MRARSKEHELPRFVSSPSPPCVMPATLVKKVLLTEWAEARYKPLPSVAMLRRWAREVAEWFPTVLIRIT